MLLIDKIRKKYYPRITITDFTVNSEEFWNKMNELVLNYPYFNEDIEEFCTHCGHFAETKEHFTINNGKLYCEDVETSWVINLPFKQLNEERKEQFMRDIANIPNLEKRITLEIEITTQVENPYLVEIIAESEKQFDIKKMQELGFRRREKCLLKYAYSTFLQVNDTKDADFISQQVFRFLYYIRTKLAQSIAVWHFSSTDYNGMPQMYYGSDFNFVLSHIRDIFENPESYIITNTQQPFWSINFPEIIKKIELRKNRQKLFLSTFFFFTIYRGKYSPFS